MNQQTKKKGSISYVSVCLIAILILVGIVLAYSVMDSTGVIGKMDTAVESDNYRISANELAVYEYQAALSQLANEYWYYQYGLMQDTMGVTKLYDSAYEYAYAMLPYYVGTGAFADQAYAYAQQYVVYCEGALEAGVSMEDEDWEELETYMTDLETTAKTSGMSLKSFIKNYIGNGISVKEVRSAMEKYLLGVKYAEIKNEELSDAVTEDELTKYRDENKGSFYKNFYHSYVLVNDSLKAEAEKCDTVDELKEVLVKFMVESKFDTLYKTHITDKKVEDPNGAETTELMVLETLLAELGFKKPVTETEKPEDAENSENDEAAKTAEAETTEGEKTEDKTETEKPEDEKTEDKKEESYKKHFTSSDTDAYKKAAYEIVKAVKSSYNTEANKISQDASTAYVDLSDEETVKKASDLQKWLFGEGRKVGDVKVITTTKTSTGSDGKETTTTTNTWYVVTKVMFLDEEKTKDAYYVKLSDDKTETGTGKEAETTEAVKDPKTAEQKANEFYAALEGEAADKRAEKFDELAVKYGAISEGGTALKESITEKSATSIGSEFSKWLYDKARTEGNMYKVKIGTSYYVAYFVEENEETWKVSARSYIASEKLNDWYDEMVKKYNVEVDTEAPETTAPAESTASKETSATKETEHDHSDEDHTH